MSNGNYRYRAQTRAVVIRYTLTFGITLLLLSVIQVSLIGRWRPFGVVPDLMAGLVICAGIFCGQYTGAIIGILAGFLEEAIGGGSGLMLMPLFYLFAGYTTGCLIRGESQRNIAAYGFCYAVTAVAREGMTVIYTVLTYREIAIGEMIKHVVLPEFGCMILFGAILYLPMKMVCKIPEGKKKNR